MDFRIRPSSKKSEQSERSLVELPMIRNFPNNGGEIRSLGLRLDAIQSNFANHQDLWRRQRDISNAGYLQLQKRFDMLEYKAYTNEKDIKKLIQLGADNRGPSSEQLAITDSAKAYTQNQISTIKHTLLQERESHKQHAKHQNQIIEQLNRRQMRMEAQIRDLISRQRQDYDHRLSDQIQEIRNNENIKQQKIENQYELMKSLISNTQRKILGEFERKLRNQTVIKDYMEDKIAQLKEQMAMEHRGMLSKQSKFVREIKESIQSIFSIIKNTQKELTQELNETQKISANNFKRLSMTVELIKERMSEQLANLTQENNQTQGQLVDLKNFVNMKLEENRELILEMEEENMHNGTQKGSRVESMNGSQHNFVAGSDNIEEGGKFSNIQKQFTQWKTMTEQKNLNVFKEISSTLKTMKLEWRKENDEIATEVGSFKQSLSNVKKSVPLEIKKSVQTIITIFNNEFDTLAQQLDTITEMIALSKKETEKNLKDEIKKSESQIMKEVKELIKMSQKQMVLLIDKGAIKQEEMMRGHVERQNKFLKDLLMQKHNSIETEVQQVAQSNKKNNLNTSSQLQDFTLKLKSFNENYKDYLEEQRKDDLKKRIQLEENMRKNASNLMDLCYKKCQFLVDGMKQAMQMNQMKDKVTLTREVQAMKEENQKKMFQTKQQIIDDVNQKIDKLSEERQNSEQTMHQAFDQQINMVKKTLSNQIGNTKLQLSQKINEMLETLNELREKGTDSTEELENSVQSLKEAVWKIQAMSFSEQAKNKAIMDRMGEDIVDLSGSIQKISNDLKKNENK